MSTGNDQPNNSSVQNKTSDQVAQLNQKNDKKVKPIGIARNFSKEVEIFHDAFRLDPADMQKNMSWIKKKPKYETFSHCHVFHSFDSSGRKQFYSTPTGGHFHKMEFKKHKDGSISLKCISGPLKWGVEYDEKLEKEVRSAIPVNPRDKHRHETTYLHSEKLIKRKRNVEAAKLMTAQAKLGERPEGTIG